MVNVGGGQICPIKLTLNILQPPADQLRTSTPEDQRTFWIESRRTLAHLASTNAFVLQSRECETESLAAAETPKESFSGKTPLGFGLSPLGQLRLSR
jgi:hypothetical protein